MTTNDDPHDVCLAPPRAYYCGFCDSTVATFCGLNVLHCQEERAARRQAAPRVHTEPHDDAARGVVVGILLGTALWAALVGGAWLLGLL